jgi:hypothetical protein
MAPGSPHTTVSRTRREVLQFCRLDAFKAKFNPEEWEPIYAIAVGTGFNPRALSTRSRLRSAAGLQSGSCSEHCSAHEISELRFVEVAIGAQSTAHIDTKRRDLSYCLRDIPGVEASRGKIQFGRRFARKKEGRDTRRHGSRNIPDAGLGNRARPARHSRHQADSRCSEPHGERGFLFGGNATDLTLGGVGNITGRLVDTTYGYCIQFYRGAARVQRLNT